MPRNNVVVVLGNDAAWGIDRQIQIGVYGRPVVSDLLPTRDDVVARGLGAHSFNVHRRSELRPALQAALVAADPRWCTWRSPSPEAHARRRQCSLGTRLRNTAHTAPGSREEQPAHRRRGHRWPLAGGLHRIQRGGQGHGIETWRRASPCTARWSLINGITVILPDAVQV